MGTSINSFFGRIAALRGARGLLGSDANFITMQGIAPEGRAKGTMNLDSDPKNPVPALRAPCTSSRKSEFLEVP